MYANKLAAAIKVGGKVLREHGDVVYLPFGSEYSVLLKNLSSVRALVTITIDGEDVLNGDALVVRANSELELERFLKDMNKGNRFKFIARTAAVEEHRGISAGDGLVRIEYQFEKPIPRPVWHNDGYNSGKMYSKGIGGSSTGGRLDGFYGSNSLTSSFCHDSSPVSLNATSTTRSAPSEIGVTAPGSISEQKFQMVSNFPVEDQKNVLVFRLLGETAENKVVEAITVKHKPKCVSCGKVNAATAKFCTECGTGLEVI